MSQEVVPIGAILAGGKSSRFNGQKLTAMLHGKRLIDYAIASVAAAGLEPLVVVKPTTVVPKDITETINVCHENETVFHPFSGILAALQYGNYKRDVLAVACDMPCIPKDLLSFLFEHPGDIVVPVLDDVLQPLCALYRPSSTPYLQDALMHQRSAKSTILQTQYKTIPKAMLQRFGDPSTFFLDIDTQEELVRFPVPPPHLPHLL